MSSPLFDKLQSPRRKIDMPLLNIKRFAQVTLPPDLRKKFNLAEGDYLEAEAIKEGILIKPVSVVERQKAGKALLKLLAEVHDQQPPTPKSPREQEEEIAGEVKAFRKQHVARRS
jgi:AbrB family looped-hinge helix DNA binding protein